jgi:hypothetical protein
LRPALGEPIATEPLAKFMMVVLTGHTTLRAVTLRSGTGRSRRRRLLPAWRTGLRWILAKLLLRPFAGLRARRPLRPALSKVARRPRLHRTIHPLATPARHEVFPPQLAIAIAIELFQNLGRVLHFLGVDHAIVIGIERIEERL